MSRAGDHVPGAAVVHMKQFEPGRPTIMHDMGPMATEPAAEHAHGQLFVPPPPPVYAPATGPPNVMSSSSMFVHSTVSAPLQYWPVEAAQGCSESERIAAAGPARARRVAAACMELLSNH